MTTSFTPEQWAYLNQSFSLYNGPEPEAASCFRTEELMDPSVCRAYLDRLTGLLQSPSRRVTASQFAKRYAFLAAASALYTISMYNKGLDFSGGAVLVERPATAGKAWSPQLSTVVQAVTEPKAGERQEWLQAAIADLFAGHLSKLWRSMSSASQLPRTILWENTAVRVYSLYEKRLQAEAGVQERKRVQDDFRFLVGEAPGSMFGEDENPLKRYFGAQVAGDQIAPRVRIRKTCCLYDQISPQGECCTTCPKVRDQD